MPVHGANDKVSSMEPLEYLSVVRRRKLLVILAVLVGAVAGWITAPGSAADQPTEFEAIHTLITSPSAPPTFNLEQAAVLVTTGAVPVRVAAAFEEGRDPVDLLKRVDVTPTAALGTIAIRVTGTNPERIAQLSNLFAQELTNELNAAATTAYNGSIAEQERRVGELQAQIAAVRAQLPEVLPDSEDITVGQQGLIDDLNASTSQLQAAQEALDQLRAQGAPLSPLMTLEQARALPVKEDGIRAPDGKPARAALLAVFGLFVGIGAAFLADRLDTRLSSKSKAERAFGLPVIAEIPHLPPGRRFRNTLVTHEHPAAPFVEAHRSLRTVILLSAEMGGVAEVGDAEEDTGEHQVVLISSPGAGEGKTTTVGHLAAVLAEAGKSVLVVSADFRRPRVHELFDAEREPGLSEVLSRRPDAPALADLDLRTNVDGVKLLASGPPVDNPAPFLPAAASLIRAARELFDFVLIDTAPILIANDAAELAACADMVVVVARAEKTTHEAAHRAAEVLRRIDAPVVGAVLVAAEDTPTAQSYYRNRYYTAEEQSSWTRFWNRLLRREPTTSSSYVPRAAARAEDRDGLRSAVARTSNGAGRTQDTDHEPSEHAGT